MSQLKVAITGAAGQIGSCVVGRMVERRDIETIAVCRNAVSAGIVHSSAPGCEIRIGSITELTSAKRLLGDCDVIINCALAMISGKPKMSRFLNKAMIDCYSHLDKLKLLIHLSSISVYGHCINDARSPKSTFDRPRPDTDYGRSKLYIEQYARQTCLSRQLRHYILRVGHVIGAKMDRSRQIIELAQNAHFQLPFNGDLSSNTIHVNHLAAMIIALLSSSLPSGIYNIADEKRTWRQVFDWHTRAIDLPTVEGMSKERSEHLKDIYRSRSIMDDVGGWLHSLPLLELMKYPTIFEYAYRLLATVPEFVTNRSATMYKRKNVGRQIAAINGEGNKILDPVYLFGAMPGKYLKIPSEVQINDTSAAVLSEQLRGWYERFSQPTWLPKSISDLRTSKLQIM